MNRESAISRATRHFDEGNFIEDLARRVAIRTGSQTESVRKTLLDCEPAPELGELQIDPCWGEPGSAATEKVYARNTFEILAFRTGNPDNPVNAIPGKAAIDPDQCLADRAGVNVITAIRGSTVRVRMVRLGLEFAVNAIDSATGKEKRK